MSRFVADRTPTVDAGNGGYFAAPESPDLRCCRSRKQRARRFGERSGRSQPPGPGPRRANQTAAHGRARSHFRPPMDQGRSACHARACRDAAASRARQPQRGGSRTAPIVLRDQLGLRRDAGSLVRARAREPSPCPDVKEVFISTHPALLAFPLPPSHAAAPRSWTFAIRRPAYEGA